MTADDEQLLKSLLSHLAAGPLELAVYLGSHEVEEMAQLYHQRNEAVVRGSGVPWVMPRPTTFMDNVLIESTPLFTVKGGELRIPSGGARIAHIDCSDTGEVAAKLLTLPTAQLAPHLSRCYQMTDNQPTTLEHVTQMLSQAAGKPVKYLDLTWEQYETGAEGATRARRRRAAVRDTARSTVRRRCAECGERRSGGAAGTEAASVG